VSALAMPRRSCSDVLVFPTKLVKVLPAYSP
jgi:hypothetical protein